MKKKKKPVAGTVAAQRVRKVFPVVKWLRAIWVRLPLLWQLRKFSAQRKRRRQANSTMTESNTFSLSNSCRVARVQLLRATVQSQLYVFALLIFSLPFYSLTQSLRVCVAAFVLCMYVERIHVLDSSAYFEASVRHGSETCLLPRRPFEAKCVDETLESK